MKRHIELLNDLGACQEAIDFADRHRSLASAWSACSRPDWMLWVLARIKYQDDQAYRLFGCWCVRNTPLFDGRKVWDLLTDSRSKNAIEVAERFAHGEATDLERDAAGAAAGDAQSDKLREMFPWSKVQIQVKKHRGAK
jgi:hypothetical protein